MPDMHDYEMNPFIAFRTHQARCKEVHYAGLSRPRTCNMHIQLLIK